MIPSYKIIELTSEEFNLHYNKHKDSLFDFDHSYLLWEALSEKELENVKRLRKNLDNRIELYFGAFDCNDNFVGWSWGFQESSVSFYMANSAVLKNHRRKGVYSSLLRTMVKKVMEEGFQVVTSRHNATNNSVLIPKLKANFIIAKMELDDIFGVLVHLHYYANSTRRKMMDYRSGQAKPDEEIKKLLKI
jgi:predicted N-acetyltransferase YhbS